MEGELTVTVELGTALSWAKNSEALKQVRLGKLLRQTTQYSLEGLPASTEGPPGHTFWWSLRPFRPDATGSTAQFLQGARQCARHSGGGNPCEARCSAERAAGGTPVSLPQFGEG
jgi:hypothetical protein